MTLPNICLMMIVKNEVETLPTLFDSVEGLISQWLIIDTGSTDGTQAVIQDRLGKIDGQLVERPWVNFGHNRTELVRMIPESCDYALLLDADQAVRLSSIEEFTDELSRQSSSDVYLVAVEDGDLEYSMPYLVKRGANFRYEGATHEFLTADRELQRVSFESLKVRHIGNGGSKVDKFERDKLLLEQDLREGKNLTRNHFYLAQTLQELGELEEAKMHYLWVAQNSLWDEERYMAYLRRGRLLKADGKPFEALENFYSALDSCPDRVEAIFEIVKILQDQKHYALAQKLATNVSELNADRILFIEKWIADWGLKMESGVIAWNLGDKVEAKRIFTEILQMPGMSDSTIALAQQNLSYC